jgi:hypothetical protein
MRTKKIKRLALSKTTVANLDTHKMGAIYGGGFDLDQDAEIPVQLYTESCNPCHLPGDPVYIETCGDCTYTCSC